jgi:alanine dehydrogenase
VLALDRATLAALLAPGDVIDALADAFRLLAGGGASVPPRGTLTLGDDAVLLTMPAALAAGGTDNHAGVKLVTYHGGNTMRDLPTLHSTYVLLDGGTGRPLALLEGTYLTALRTGATSALAARYLARPDARRLVCFGAGVQAAFQLRCLAAVRALEQVTVVGRNPERARAFAARLERELDIPVGLETDPARALRDADLVTCATTSPTPVFGGAALRPGTHVDAVGAFRPAERELDSETVRRARVVVDTYEGALQEAGDILIPIAQGLLARHHVAAELAELVTGTRPGRTSVDQITVFKSVGFALEDVATARLAYNRAMASGAGSRIIL